MRRIGLELMSCEDLDMELREILEISGNKIEGQETLSANQEILRQILEPLGIIRSAKGTWQGAFDKTFLTPRYLETFHAVIIQSFNDYKTYTPKEVIAYIRRLLHKERYKLVYWQVGKERLYRYIILNT